MKLLKLLLRVIVKHPVDEKNGCVQEENSSPCVKYDVSEKARQDRAGGASRRSRRGGVKIKLFRSPVR